MNQMIGDDKEIILEGIKRSIEISTKWGEEIKAIYEVKSSTLIGLKDTGILLLLIMVTATIASLLISRKYSKVWEIE